MNLALYAVYGGKRYMQEAVRSARSLRQHCPDLPIWLISDKPTMLTPFNIVRRLEMQPEPPLLTKAYALATAPLPDDARVLFLDTDTYVMGDLRPMFGLLDRFDMALTHSFTRDSGPRQLKTPLGYKDFSSGMMLYRWDRVRALFAAWYERYRTQPDLYGDNDQTSLTDEIYQSDARFYVLPPEFNVRVAGDKYYLAGFAYVLHGRGATLERAIKNINKNKKARIWK